MAAAASVPFSSTSTNALCTTAEITRSREPFIPEKSASPPVNAAGIPSEERASLSSHSAVSLNRGRMTCTRHCDSVFTQLSSLAGESEDSSAASPSRALGKTTTMERFPP